MQVMVNTYAGCTPKHKPLGMSYNGKVFVFDKLYVSYIFIEQDVHIFKYFCIWIKGLHFLIT